jgi:N,N'-diacetylbacillosaminyl-diphospho-undecaprenol alpha-1,3-N-acetylgalactosaminyltransferase
MSRLRVAIIENTGLDLFNYRLPLAKYLIQNGFEVFAIIQDDGYVEKLKEVGIKTLTYDLKRNSLSIKSQLKSISQLRKYSRDYNFSIIHSFSLQPNIIGTLAFGHKKKVIIINHITGLGYSFTSTSLKAIFYKIITFILYQIIFLRTNRIIVQNRDDKAILSKLIGIKKKILIVEGSGVDHQVFCRDNIKIEVVEKLKKELQIKEDNIVITFVGRLLKEKGINEFLYAANYLSQRYPRVKFLIIGWLDPLNPSSLNQMEMSLITQSKNICYLGLRDDVKEILYLSTMFVLPTYREGMPRSILEALSLELPVITTDVPGARDTVINNENGFIVRVRDSKALINAMQELRDKPDRWKEMGAKGRKMVKERFCGDIIYNSILNIYRELLYT